MHQPVQQHLEHGGDDPAATRGFQSIVVTPRW
jgi:hypothetical protein